MRHWIALIAASLATAVSAANVKVTPLGSHDGEFCPQDRALVFEDPNGTRILYDPGRTVLSVAYACGYASDSSLRRAMQDFIGTIPTTLRREGAFARASKLFNEERTERRLWGKDRKRPSRVRS